MKKFIKLFINGANRLLLNSFYNNCISRSANVHVKSILNLTTVGAYSYIGPFVVINNTVIGNYCSIAPSVIIGGMEHDYSAMATSTYLSDYKRLKPTEIGDDVWIGAGAYIRAGITLGKGCIIGANSTVLTDIPPMAIAVGSPARIIKYRFTQPDRIEKYTKLNFSGPKAEIRKIIDSSH